MSVFGLSQCVYGESVCVTKCMCLRMYHSECVLMAVSVLHMRYLFQ